jgi:exodeoxyribonuclease VII small subunit
VEGHAALDAVCAFTYAPRMSKPSKAAESGRIENLPFEDALNRLEAIVDSMESDELALEELLARYEAGMRLAQACQSKIADAELKIQRLEKNAEGMLVLKPVDLGGAGEKME